MTQIYHKLYVPQAIWDEIVEDAVKMTAMRPTTLALSYLRSGLPAGIKTGPFKTEPIKIKKTKKKDYILYVYNGEGPDGFSWEERADHIGELKKFFAKMGDVTLHMFEKCLWDPSEKPIGMELEYVADYATQLWEKKREAQATGGKYDAYER